MVIKLTYVLALVPLPRLKVTVISQPNPPASRDVISTHTGRIGVLSSTAYDGIVKPMFAIAIGIKRKRNDFISSYNCTTPLTLSSWIETTSKIIQHDTINILCFNIFMQCVNSCKF